MEGNSRSGPHSYDRAHVVRLGIAAAFAPLLANVTRAGAALEASHFPRRPSHFARLKKNGRLGWYGVPGGGYFYVPHRFFASSDPKTLRFVASQLGFKPAAVKHDDLAAQAFKQLGVVELSLPAANVPALLHRKFVKISPDRPPRLLAAVAPHYAQLGEPEYQGGPGGPPDTATALDDYKGVAEKGPRVRILDTLYFRGRPGGLDAHVTNLSTAKPADGPDSDGDGVLDDEVGHSDFIAGIVAREAPNAAIETVDVLDAWGVGTEGTVVPAIYAAAVAGVDVINLSLGTNGDPVMPPLPLSRAIAFVAQRSPATAIVAAAGNNHTSAKWYPAALPPVIGVAAMKDAVPTPSPYSNFGSWVTCSTVADNLTSSFVDWQGMIDDGSHIPKSFQGWATWSGTSFAAAKVSGAIAAKVNAGTTAQQAAATLLSSGTTFPNYGRFLTI